MITAVSAELLTAQLHWGCPVPVPAVSILVPNVGQSWASVPALILTEGSKLQGCLCAGRCARSDSSQRETRHLVHSWWSRGLQLVNSDKLADEYGFIGPEDLLSRIWQRWHKVPAQPRLAAATGTMWIPIIAPCILLQQQVEAQTAK